MSKIKNIIFDLDGTLWDSRQQILNAWNKVLQNEYDISLNVNDFNNLMGKTSDFYKKAFFSNYSSKQADYILNLCEKEEVIYLKQHGANIFKNSISTLKKLSKKYKLFIVSNCQSGYIESFLEYYNLNELIKDFECNGNTKKSKEDNINIILKRNCLKSEETCYIGDTSNDYLSAINNNILFIYAQYGFGNLSHHSHSIKDIGDLVELIENIN